MTTANHAEAMQSYQDAIDGANRAVMRLADARLHMESATMALRGAPDAAEPGSLHHQVETLMLTVRAAHFDATIAAADAGARATAEWERRTGQAGSIRFIR